MTRLLVVHHTPSPHLHTLLEAVREGAGDPQIEGVEVVVRAALAASASDVLEADGFVIGGPANLGYLAGALKLFFDVVVGFGLLDLDLAGLLALLRFRGD